MGMTSESVERPHAHRFGEWSGGGVTCRRGVLFSREGLPSLVEQGMT